MPFTNLSNDPEQEYFSDGIVEAILDHLFKIGELKVTSGTSTKRYKNTELSVKEIGRELDVSSILEGSVQKMGNNVRITAQLIDAKSDVHLWSETYDRNISDIFSIQSEVAQTVARELKATLTLKAKGQIEKNQTSNVEAYDLYLQGRFFWNQRTEEGQKKSIECFEKSIAIDPDYALAYTGLADAYFILTWYRWLPNPEGYVKAKKYALRAIEIDKNLAEAHAALGWLLFWSECKWEEARKELKLAIELNPNYANAHQYYAELLDILRQDKEAREQINLALELDPLSLAMNSNSVQYYYNEGKLKESLEACRRLEEIDFYRTQGVYDLYSSIYLRQGENVKAVEAIQKMLPGDTLIIKDVYNKSGITGIFNWLIERQFNKSKPSSLSLSFEYAWLGKNEETLNWLEKAFEENYTSLPAINNNRDFDILRSEPRFQAIIKKMGLSEYQKKE